MLLEKKTESMSLVDGVGFGATVIWWFNATSMAPNTGETPGETSPLDATYQIATLLAGVAVALTLIALFTVADRRQHR